MKVLLWKHSIFVAFYSVLHKNSAKIHSCTYLISLFFLEKKEWNLNCFHFFGEMKSEIIFLFTQLLPPTSLQSQNRQKCRCRIVKNVDAEWSKMLMQNRQKCWCRIVKNVDAVIIVGKKRDRRILDPLFFFVQN